VEHSIRILVAPDGCGLGAQLREKSFVDFIRRPACALLACMAGFQRNPILLLAWELSVIS
jgi:hypothetical protein